MQEKSLYLTMDITNTCNARCVMCYFSLPGFKPKGQNMSSGTFQTIIDKLVPYSGALALSCEFEPLVHPDVSKIFCMAAKLDHWNVRVNTNGIGLNNEVLEALIAGRIKNLVVSLDGADETMNYALRRHRKFNHIIGMLKTLAEKKQKEGLKYPCITVRQTLLQANLDHVSRMIPLLAEVGVDRFSVKHLVPIEGCMFEGETLDKQSVLLVPEKTCEVFQEARARAEEYGLAIDLPPSSPRSEEELKLCCKPVFNGFHIYPDGRCFPCVWLTHLSALGNLADDSVEDILAGESLKTLQEDFRSGNVRYECLRCLKDTQTVGLKMFNDASERLLNQA